jgi:hypothetical protein
MDAERRRRRDPWLRAASLPRAAIARTHTTGQFPSLGATASGS